MSHTLMFKKRCHVYGGLFSLIGICFSFLLTNRNRMHCEQIFDSSKCNTMESLFSISRIHKGQYEDSNYRKDRILNFLYLELAKYLKLSEISHINDQGFWPDKNTNLKQSRKKSILYCFDNILMLFHNDTHTVRNG